MTTSYENKASLHQLQLVHFWIPKERDGCALLVRPSRIPRWISKIIFALGSHEFLAMLEGKTRKGLFF